ncbi:MAG: 7TM diverse intracellular signaling domain-containing protein [Campylobacterales bacterium]
MSALLKSLLLLLLIVSSSLSLELNSSGGNYDDFSVSYLKSSKDFEEIKSQKDGWVKRDNRFAFGYYFDDIWMKVDIKNNSKPKEVFLEFSEPFADILDFYVVEDGKVERYKNGLRIPLDNREIKTPLPTIKLQFKSDESKQIFIKYRSKFTSYGKLDVFDTQAYDKKKIIYTAFYFFYFGGIIVIAAYNLFLFFALRDRSYMYYVGYALTFALWVFLYSGFSLYFMDGDTHYKLHFTTPFAFVFFTLFTQSILETKATMPKIHKILNMLAVVLLVSSLYIVFDVEHGYYLANIIGFLYFPFLMFVSILSIKKGVKTAKFYLVSFLIFICTMTILTNLAMGLIEYNIITKYSFIIGSIVELVLFSLLLAYRINILKEEKLEFQEKLLEIKQYEAIRLEKVVNDKTDDLKVANIKLKSMIQERETLLRELHHRVKNNLQIIIGMLFIQIKKSLNKEGSEMLNELLGRIKSMALVHELLYSSDSTTQIPTDVYFEKLISSVIAGMHTKHIEVKKEIEDVYLSAEESVAVGTILTEVVTNSIKHAFANVERPYISISLRSKDGMHILEIADNGCGIDENAEKSEGFGMKIIQKTSRSLKNSSVKYYKDRKNSLFTFYMEFA